MFIDNQWPTPDTYSIYGYYHIKKINIATQKSFCFSYRAAIQLNTGKNTESTERTSCYSYCCFAHYVKRSVSKPTDSCSKALIYLDLCGIRVMLFSSVEELTDSGLLRGKWPSVKTHSSMHRTKHHLNALLHDPAQGVVLFLRAKWVINSISQTDLIYYVVSFKTIWICIKG